jgi:hypothetical protein
MRTSLSAVRVVAFIFTLVCMLCIGRVARADGKTIVVIVEGKGGDAVEDDIKSAAASRSANVADGSLFKKAFAKHHAGAIAPLLAANKQAALVKWVHAALESVHADAAIIGSVSKAGRERKVILVAISKSASAPLLRREVVAKAGDAKITGAENDVLAEIVPSGPTAAAPPPPPPPPVKEKEKEKEELKEAAKPEPPKQKEEEKKPEPEPPSRVRFREREIIDLGLTFGLAGRSFSYKDPISNNLRPYSVFGAPTLALSGSLYPLAFDRKAYGIGSDIGLEGEYATAFGVSSKASDGTKSDNTWNRFALGLRARIHLGDGKAPAIGISVAYGGEKFGFAASTLTSQVPDVAYDFIRPAADIRVPFGPAAVTAKFGYDVVTGGGVLKDRFPKASVGGIDANLGVTYELITHLEASVSGRYRRFFYTFNPTPGDAYIAGGGLDAFYDVDLGLNYFF